MITTIARWLEHRFGWDYDLITVHLNRLIVTVAAGLFIILSTAIVGFEDIFPSGGGLASLSVGDIAPRDISAPERITYFSDVLTQQRREEARTAISPEYTPPNPAVAQQQINTASSILDFIVDVRAAPFETEAQKIRDLQQIRAVALSPTISGDILAIDNEVWALVEDEVIAVLGNQFQERVREVDIAGIRNNLLNQVDFTFPDRERNVIAALVQDLLQPNSLVDGEATESAREAAAQAIDPVQRTIERGEIIIRDGIRVEPLQLETLEQFGMLHPEDTRSRGIAQAFLGSVVVMVVAGLYIAHFRSSLLYREPRLLTLLAIIFLIVLAGARLGLSGEVYIYPTAALALLYVSVVGQQIAVIGVLGLAFLVGLMATESLEITTLVAVGGIIGALMLRRSERLNSFFFAGLMVSVSNLAVMTLFNLSELPGTSNPTDVSLLMVYSVLNGILTAAAAMAGLYIVTLIFNLPTALKLSELLQPNQPLLQRLLREAPGTYQHSLQVANMSEQAANAIGANAELTHVGALYHDIGKMLNPAFFTENQRDIGNPHDALNDPYRSADIIVGHATQGDEMARQYRLPNRLRDFIREHHGTSEVYVFYKQAVILAGDEAMVDIDDFRYKGPKPQSRETAVLMLADSSEAAVRSRQPKTRQEIEDIINQVFDGKRKGGQLDESGLTLNDLNAIRSIFIEMLQGMFHPRINYDEAVARVRKKGSSDVQSKPVAEAAAEKPVVSRPKAEVVAEKAPDVKSPGETANPTAANGNTRTTLPKKQTMEISLPPDDDDDAPLAEVPRLRRTGESKSATGTVPKVDDQPEDKDESVKSNGDD